MKINSIGSYLFIKINKELKQIMTPNRCYAWTKNKVYTIDLNTNDILRVRKRLWRNNESN